MEISSRRVRYKTDSRCRNFDTRPVQLDDSNRGVDPQKDSLWGWSCEEFVRLLHRDRVRQERLEKTVHYSPKWLAGRGKREMLEETDVGHGRPCDTSYVHRHGLPVDVNSTFNSSLSLSLRNFFLYDGHHNKKGVTVYETILYNGT